RVGQLDVMNTELVQEKEEALDQLEDAKARIGELETKVQHVTKYCFSQSPGPDEETVANIARLLSAVERLRGERDGLRRDMEFLDMESKFTIAALEAKIASTPLPFSQPAIPLIRVAPPEETSPAVQRKEMQRLQGLILGCGIVIGHLEKGRLELEQRCNSAYCAYEEKARGVASTEARLRETECRLETTIQLLEETTTHRNDTLSRL
ncbi:hypothetical protein BT96DRAFT_793786, partial [Gymnopus androsaceus JB14]